GRKVATTTQGGHSADPRSVVGNTACQMSSALDELHDLAVTSGEPTPRRIFLASAARERFDHMARLRDVLGRPPLELVAAYSLKTNPRPELLAMARERGFWAECISQDEVDWAAR